MAAFTQIPYERIVAAAALPALLYFMSVAFFVRIEAKRLNLAPRQLAWVREVRLCGDGRPWVLARTVIPQNCLHGHGRRLRNLGNKPLGAYLFSSPEWQRGPLETGLCKVRSNGHPRLARRSLFHRGSCALLVGEYLLPRLYQSPNRG